MEKRQKIRKIRNMIRVAELFAGVGGFRVGLERAGGYEVVFSNQWEPSTKKQWASEVYEARFGSDGHTNIDVNDVEVNSMPDFDLLVGGFPCQDYSVASTSQNSKGLIGKKGVLWWSIHKILRDKETKPKYILLENVDRILKSPTAQRGRDFAVILKSLEELGYAVEWRVINAAEYGMPQRRKRIFIMGFLKGTDIYNTIKDNQAVWLVDNGISTKSFPTIKNEEMFSHFNIEGDILSVSSDFNKGKKTSPFENSGVMIDGMVMTKKVDTDYSGPKTVLKDILQSGVIPDEFFVEDLTRWEYFKGAKKEKRTTADGYEYLYSEGGMAFPDSIDKPSRTIITGEGGKSASRFKHVIKIGEKHRRLTPLELERLNMFPDNHTYIEGVTPTKRAFFMGNALVVGIVEKLGTELMDRVKIYDKVNISI
jgi:DNA (cytosine-5)-methyltransferase 1